MSTTSELAILRGNKHSHDYIGAMEDFLLPFSSQVYTADWIYKQDNAAIHNRKVTREWFTKEKIEHLP